ncbi:Acetoacetate--CoA ligase [Rhodovastum atsumiense]|uniref:Acetoacetate--CoA ligase n=1 Tax=Rhodovastum atsumiense TaxID=504468 RepID=A0A5M6IJM3_9PROT|nr:acetoacetate--CoA ligase [Rhodovastum atsumiense]KAA5608450.1 acetoacetate--CoA ligase [Rhodovastum atsumiense]CAH2604643.1 Acetoacetate--CoA ligase [Rhodovastum atsumiense]
MSFAMRDIEDKRPFLRITGRKAAAPAPMWVPDPLAVAGSALSDFMAFCRSRSRLDLADPAALHRFSVERFQTFWGYFLDWSQPLHEGESEVVCTSQSCETARFFPGLRLSYAENLLAARAPGDDERPAIIACHADAPPEILTRAQLRHRVQHVAGGLRRLGIGPGDRVAAIAGNGWQPVVAALASSMLGASFSAAAPDMGAEAVLDRFGELEPVLLFCDGATDPRRGERLAAIIAGLPGLRGVVTLDDGAAVAAGCPVHRLHDLAAGPAEGRWQRFPFDHPLFVLFSSGTTGRPKCIVHGAGGTLLEHLKEHRLHGDLGRSDRLFFQTSCAWMMWNWQLSALATGAGIVVYDGPVTGPGTLWDIVAAQRVTRFGTSPAYLRLCQERDYVPARAHDLSALRGVMSTGSILYDDQFDWVMQAVGRVPVQSISGGTDIIGCFVLGNPNLPVWRGEAQCRSLGLDVQAVDASGATVLDQVGELVCRTPFPSRPIAFLGDSDGGRFHGAYFARTPGVWTHGDLVSFTPHGTARLYGRSDGVINVRGIRIGPAEFDAALRDVTELRACLGVEQAAPEEPGGTRLVLLVALQPGVTLDATLQRRIRAALARRASPAHVPAVIAAIPDMPTTHSGKRSERAAHDAVNRRPAGNRAALRNPDVLDLIASHPDLHGAGGPAAPVMADRGTPLERLTAIWESVLGIAPIGLDDNFFDLGGHSLTALRIADAVTASFGQALPVTALLRAPTIAGLVALLEQNQPGGNTVAELRPGGFPPLFVVPSIAGTVIEMYRVLSALNAGRAVYALQARGVDGTEPRRRIDEMAADYISGMRSVQKQGPYAFVGYSFGGLVAYEMACQLRAQGEQVALVALIDSGIHPRNLSTRGWLGFHARVLRHVVRQLHSASSRELRQLASRVTHGVGRKVQQVLGRPSRVRSVAGHALPPALQRVRAAAGFAYARYRLPPYPGKVVFFRATRRDPLYCEPVEILAHRSGAVEVYHLPGDHADMVEGNNAVNLAGRLDTLLGRPQDADVASPGPGGPGSGAQVRASPT